MTAGDERSRTRVVDAALIPVEANRADPEPLSLIKSLETDEERVELRAATGPDYGRIYDRELVEAAMRIVAKTDDARHPGALRHRPGRALLRSTRRGPSSARLFRRGV